MISRKVINAAKKHYTNLPYHNFIHVKKVLNSAKLIVKRYEGKVDEQALYHAVLFHDAGYEKNHKSLGFDTKEHLSASIASIELKKLGYSQEHINKVKQIILATLTNANPRTVEEKIIRASDLANLKGSYKGFLKNNELLREEFRLLHGKDISIEEWKKNTDLIINNFLKEDIKLTKYYYDKKGNSAFHTKTKKNLNRYLTN